jgi:hypothetical protein
MSVAVPAVFVTVQTPSAEISAITLPEYRVAEERVVVAGDAELARRLLTVVAIPA